MSASKWQVEFFKEQPDQVMTLFQVTLLKLSVTFALFPAGEGASEESQGLEE